MSTERNITRVSLLVLVLAASLGRADSTGEPPPSGQCKNPILGIIEGPDPVTGRCAWETPVLHAGTGRSRRGQGMGRDARSDRSVTVWAARVGDDHDIALGEWGDDGRASVVYLTATFTDDLDPVAAFDPQGALHVVWWSRGERDVVVHARRDPVSGGWWPDRIVAQDARTPALAVADGLVWIAYVRNGSGAGAEIVLGATGDDREIEPAVVARTGQRDVTGLTLSVTDGRPQLVWTEGDGRVVRAERWGTAWVRHDVGGTAR